MSLALILLIGIVGLLFILFKRWVKIYDFWKERGLVHPKPYPIVGNMINNLLKKRSMGEVYHDIATEYNQHKYIGVYTFITADLLINDADLINTVLVKEFSYFTDRIASNPAYLRTLDNNLFLLNGARWKGVRTKISPAFSSGKLKGMFHIMTRCYENTSKIIDRQLNSREIVFTDIIDMYVISVAASTIYGIDTSSLTDLNSEFQNWVNKVFAMDFTRFVLSTLNILVPSLLVKLNVATLGKKAEDYFINLVINTFKERVESGKVKDDIIQQLLQLKQNGKIEVTQWISEDADEFGNIETSNVTETVEITGEILVAQGFIFLLAGVDVLKSTLTMLLIELCRNPSVLEKLREEVNSCSQKNDGISFESVKDMEYLDWCLSETMRLHPPTQFTNRICVKDFTFPDGMTVKKGTRVVFPLSKFLIDAAYFPEPDKFKPERFLSPPPAWVFIPFGLGPRMCIARRYALMEMKLFIARIIQDYDISLDPRTELPVRTDKWFILRRHLSPIHINFSKRNKA